MCETNAYIRYFSPLSSVVEDFINYPYKNPYNAFHALTNMCTYYK